MAAAALLELDSQQREWLEAAPSSLRGSRLWAGYLEDVEASSASGSGSGRPPDSGGGEASGGGAPGVPAAVSLRTWRRTGRCCRPRLVALDWTTIAFELERDMSCSS